MFVCLTCMICSFEEDSGPVTHCTLSAEESPSPVCCAFAEGNGETDGRETSSNV